MLPTQDYDLTEKLNYSELREESIKYQGFAAHLQIQDTGFELIERIKSILPSTAKSLILTNFNKPNVKGIYYIVKFSEDRIEMLEVNKTFRTNIKLISSSREIFLNGQKMGLSYLIEFSKRMREIIADLKSDLCFVFEESY